MANKGRQTNEPIFRGASGELLLLQTLAFFTTSVFFAVLIGPLAMGQDPPTLDVSDISYAGVGGDAQLLAASSVSVSEQNKLAMATPFVTSPLGAYRISLPLLLALDKNPASASNKVLVVASRTEAVYTIESPVIGRVREIQWCTDTFLFLAVDSKSKQYPGAFMIGVDLKERAIKYIHGECNRRSKNKNR